MQLAPLNIMFSLRKLVDAYWKKTHDVPLDAVDKAVAGMEKLGENHKLRWGPTAAVTFPLCIIARNTAHMLDPKNKVMNVVRNLGGFAGCLGGWALAGKAIFSTITSLTAVAGIGGKILAVGAAAALAVPAIPLGSVLGIFAVSAAAAAATAAASAFPCAMNMTVGIRRSRDAIRYGTPPEPEKPASTLVQEMAPITPIFTDVAVDLERDITFKKVKFKLKTLPPQNLPMA